MRKSLSKEELNLLSQIKKIEVTELLKIKDLLDHKEVLRLLIKHDHAVYVKEKHGSTKGALDMLGEKYGVSRSYIEKVVYNIDQRKTNKTEKI